MKRRKTSPQSLAAKRQQEIHRLFNRIFEAACRLSAGGVDMWAIQESAMRGMTLTEDRRKRAAAKLTRQRQYVRNAEMRAAILRLSNGGKRSVTVARVLAECPQYDPRTVRRELKSLLLAKPDKPGPKRKR